MIKDTIYKDLLSELKDKPNSGPSGGELQRAGFIRGIIKKSSILIADEPAGSVDDDMTRVMYEILKEESKNKLIMVISHDKDIIKTYANTIIKREDSGEWIVRHVRDLPKKSKNFYSIKSFTNGIFYSGSNWSSCIFEL